MQLDHDNDLSPWQPLWLAVSFLGQPLALLLALTLSSQGGFVTEVSFGVQQVYPLFFMLILGVISALRYLPMWILTQVKGANFVQMRQGFHRNNRLLLPNLLLFFWCLQPLEAQMVVSWLLPLMIASALTLGVWVFLHNLKMLLDVWQQKPAATAQKSTRPGEKKGKNRPH